MPDRAPTAELLPYYARTLTRVRVEELKDLSTRELARELSHTIWRPRLVRGASTTVSHSTIARIEAAEHWPRDPDAWIGAYAELSGADPFDMWAEAMETWAAELRQPGPAARAAATSRRAAAAKRQAEKNSSRTPTARRRK